MKLKFMSTTGSSFVINCMNNRIQFQDHTKSKKSMRQIKYLFSNLVSCIILPQTAQNLLHLDQTLSLSLSLPLFLSIYLKLWYPTMFYILRLINDARGQISVLRRGEMRKILSSVFIKHLNVTERVNKSSNLLFIKTICGLFLLIQQSAPIFFDII